MILKLLKFESAFRIRQTSLYLLSIIFLAIVVISFVDTDSGIVNGNSPYRISLFINLISLAGVIPVMLFSISTVLRDVQNNFEEIVYSTSITKFQYFISRFLSVFVSALIVCSLPVMAMYLIDFFDPYVNSGESDFRYHLWSWLILLLPNIFVATVIIFSVSLLTENATMTFVSGLLLYVVFWISCFFINSPLTGGRVLAVSEILNLFSVVDLFGFSAFFEQTQFWTIHEKNKLLFTLAGNLSINRLVWLFLSFVCLVVVYRKFNFRSAKTRQTKTKLSDTAAVKTTYELVKSEPQLLSAQIRMLISNIRLELRGVVFTKPFVIIFLVWGIINISGMHFLISGEEEFGGRYPNPELLMGIIGEAFSVLGIFLVIFYSGELMWRDRAARFHEIIYSTPVSNNVYLISKFIVLSSIVFIFLTLAIFVGVGFQVIHDYPVSLSEFLSVYYYYGFPVLLIACFGVFVQVAMPNKYIAMIITAAIVLFFGPMAQQFGLGDFPMLRFLHLDSIVSKYSEMSGFGVNANIFNAFLIYWLSVVFIIILFSFKCLKRTVNVTIRTFIQSMLKPFSKVENTLIAMLVIAFALSGGHIYYNLYYLIPDELSSDEHWFNEHYERKYKQYENLPLLQVTDVKTKVDIYPQNRRVLINADYIVKNTTNAAVDKVLVSTPEPLESLQFKGGRLILRDSLLKVYLFEFDSVISPGSTVNMTFTIDRMARGFEIDNAIVENGSYLSHNRFDPFLGYVDFLEIENPEERRKRGLPEKNRLRYNDPHLQDRGKFTFNKVNYETVISTSGDQTALSSGELVRQWKDDNRNYFHYKSGGQIRKVINYISADYDIAKTNYMGVDIEMYYHPSHHQNIEMMKEYTKQTLDYATKNFGPYQHSYIRIAEIPGHRGFGGQAMPGLIALTEGAMYTKDIRNPEKGINVVARRAIHEIAHQWWSHQLTPKNVVGGQVLTEALCKYSEAVVLEKIYGAGMVRRLSDYTCRRYFTGRAYAKDPEPPLYLTDRQQYLAYSKGYLVLNALKRLLGEEQINKTLRALLKKHSEFPTATTQDLLEELYKVAPIEYHNLIDDWMKRVVLYDVSIKNASFRKTQEGNFEVAVQISAKRIELNESGEEIEIGIDEPIEIGLYAKHPSDLKKGEQPIYLMAHKIQKEDTFVYLTVDQMPEYIALDPYLTRPDKNRLDNLLKISSDGK